MSILKNLYFLTRIKSNLIKRDALYKRFIKAFFKQNPKLAKGRVLDLGANIGLFSKFVLQNGGTVVAVEPDTVALQKLLKLQENFSVEILPLAVTGENGFRHLYRHKSFNKNRILLTESSSVIPSKTNVDEENKVVIYGVTLGRILDHFGYFDLIKIDIEGAEFEIISDLINYSNLYGLCMIELHGDRLGDFKYNNEEIKSRIIEYGLQDKIRFDWI